MRKCSIEPDFSLVWHYNDAPDGKGPMGGVGGTQKNDIPIPFYLIGFLLGERHDKQNILEFKFFH